MTYPNRRSWMLRTEAGFNGYVTRSYQGGVFIARGKVSYVYKKPHHVGQVNAAIVGAPGSFTVESFTSAQNLVSPSLELFWQSKWGGYLSVTYDGEYGSGYTSNQFYGTLGIYF